MDKYVKLETLGHGTYGSVILVKSFDRKKYAMKRIVVENDDTQAEKIENEIKILNNLDHENIIKYIESFTHKKKFCIVMEYADGGDLQTIIKNHSDAGTNIEEEKIWDWLYQLMKALEHIHSKKIIHRDIKGQNILLTKAGVIKLGDFGVSKILESTHDFAKTSLGTPYFLSPEICSGSVYNAKSDIWMLGCVLYECCTLKKPFEADTFHNLMKAIINNKQSSIPKKYSEDLRQLIDILLEKNPNVRPSINEVAELAIVKKNIAKYVMNLDKEKLGLDRVKDFKAKFELSTKEFDSKLSIHNNYPSNTSASTNNDVLSPQMNQIPTGKINLQNYALVKEKFNSYKKDILRNKKYSPSYSNDEMQRIINNMDISPIHYYKDNMDTNPVDNTLVPPFELEKNGKDTLEKTDDKNIFFEHHSQSEKKKVENKIPLNSKRGHTRQISFNVIPSSSQYMVSENMDSNSYHHHKKNVSAMKIESLEDTIMKKNSTAHKMLGELIEKNKNLELNVSFVKNKIGKEKFDFLIQCIEQSENPFDCIAPGDVAQKICGKEFPSVMGMLKKILLTALSINGVK